MKKGLKEFSLKSKNLLENETKNFNNSIDISNLDVMSNASFLNFGKRSSNTEKSQDHSKDKANKWVVKTTLDMNINRDELGKDGKGNWGIEVPYPKCKHILEIRAKFWLAIKGERRGGDFWRNLRTDIGEGMRYLQSTYSNKEPSNYSYREPSRDGSSFLDRGNRVEYFGHDQAMLIRQLEELKDRL